MKKTLALMLAASMALSVTGTTVFAADATITDTGEGSSWGTSGPVDGEGTVQNPIISYRIPTDLDFALNAFSKGESDAAKSQIYSPTFAVVNQSDIPIRVTMKAWVETANGAAIKTAPDSVNTTDPTKDDKDVYMEAVALSGINGTFDPTAGYNTTDGTIMGLKGTVPAYAPDADNLSAATKARATMNTYTSGDHPTTMVYALEKAQYGSTDNFTGITTATGAGLFRFMGTINPVADWQAHDVTAHAIFDIAGLTQPMYTTLLPSSLDADLKAANVAEVAAPIISGQPTVTTGANGAFTFTATDGNEITAVTGMTLTNSSVSDQNVLANWTVTTTSATAKNSGLAFLVTGDNTFTFTFTTTKGIRTVTVVYTVA